MLLRDTAVNTISDSKNNAKMTTKATPPDALWPTDDSQV
jgi:hypothetical protein